MSFVNAFYLIGAASVVIPLLLHFVRQMKAKQVAFGSLMFLTPTNEQVIKKRKLRDVLLMLARAALFVLLALVFARPYLQNKEISIFASEANTSTVVLLDQSFSMYADGTFDRAKTEVTRILNESKSTDEVAVVTFSDHWQQLTQFDMSFSAQAQVIASLNEPSSRSTDFLKPLRAAEDILKSARHADRKVVLVSDLQMTGWSGAFENWNLPSGVAFETRNVGISGQSNRYFEGLHISKRLTGGGGQSVALRFDARVNHTSIRDEASSGQGTASSTVSGSASRLATDVVMEIDGVEIATRSLQGTDKSRLTFQHTIESAGVYQGSLRLDTDQLLVDNTLYFTVPIGSKPKIAIFDSRARSRFSDTYFLETAFAASDNGLYEVNRRTRASLSSGPSSEDKIAFLANATSLTGREVAGILRWVENGGYLILSQGSQVDPVRMSANLEAFGIGTSDRIIDARSSFGETSIVGDVESRHPIFQPLTEAGGGVILRPEFRRYLRIVPDSSAQVLALFDSGDPFLIERKHGMGSILVHTSTISNAWTDFPIDELFVPFLYQVAAYAVESSGAEHMYRVGDVVALRGRAGEVWEVRSPTGDVFNVELTTIENSGQSIVTGYFRDTERQGHYLAINGSERFLFSVNLDPMESDVRPRDEAESYAAVASPFVDGEVETQVAGLTTDGDEKQKLWPFLLALALVVFGIETLLANKGIARREIT